MAKLVQVREAEAQGPVRAVFEAARAALRATLVGSPLRAWASAPGFLERLWRELDPVVRTRYFEAGADRIRERAVDLVDELAKPSDHLPIMRVAGISDRDIGRIRDTLAVFHYLDPKLVLIAEAVRIAWRGEGGAPRPRAAAAEEPLGAAARAPGRRPEDQIPSGIPSDMLAPALVDPEGGAASELVRTILGEVAALFDGAEPPAEFLALASFPSYLDLAWRDLKPVVQKEGFAAAASELRKTADEIARGFPRPLAIDRAELTRLAGGERSPAIEAIEALPRRASYEVLATAFLAQNLYGGEIARRPPFPIDPGRSRRRAPAPPSSEKRKGV
jgi:hypothetical protein